MSKAGINKEKIILAAANLAAEDGLSNLNFHKLADKLGVRPPSLYNHVSGIEGLKRDMMLYAIPVLTKKVTLAVVGLSDMAALKAFSMAYYTFAVENPGLYEAMQWWNRSADEEVHEAFNDFISVIDKILAPYKLDEQQRQHIYCLLRGAMHGFSSIAAFAGFDSDMPLRENFEWAIDVTLNGLNNTLKDS